ncbi:MAG: SAM-dependent chlorinase/fluorinase [Limnochordales bacterium]|nr:SAM-dependent chlorinase/fluorinase [Limnochordales bacterium]
MKVKARVTGMAGNSGSRAGFQFISFLTDFGLEAESVAICKGVIARINPSARVIDITHGIPAFDVRAGALALASAVTYLPVAVHLAVVDPGVGSGRQAVALVAGRGDVLVGPDNGLLRPAADALGGIVEAYRVENREYMLHPVSATFHARDIFAPAAAHISRGVDPAKLGAPVEIAELVPAPWQDRWLPKEQWLPALTGTGGEGATASGCRGLSESPWQRQRQWQWEGTIIGFDQYGSARLDLRLRPEEDPWGVVRQQRNLSIRMGGSEERPPIELPWVRTYSDVPPGTPCLLVDSDGRLLIAVNQGSAREQLGLRAGQRLVITVPPVPPMLREDQSATKHRSSDAEYRAKSDI